MSIDSLCEQISKEMHNVMYSMIEMDISKIEHQIDLDTLTLLITMRENGDTNIEIYNEDGLVSIPKLEKVICDSLPEWEDVKNEYKKIHRQPECQDDFAVYGNYD